MVLGFIEACDHTTPSIQHVPKGVERKTSTHAVRRCYHSTHEPVESHLLCNCISHRRSTHLNPPQPWGTGTTPSTPRANSTLTGDEFVNSRTYIRSPRLASVRVNVAHLLGRGLIRYTTRLRLWSAMERERRRYTDVINCGPIPSPVHGVESIAECFILGYVGEVVCVSGR